MNDILESIARENFRTSGYITHPSRERRVRWTFINRPRSPDLGIDAVRMASRRRERAFTRYHSKPSLLKSLLNVILP